MGRARVGSWGTVPGRVGTKPTETWGQLGRHETWGGSLGHRRRALGTWTVPAAAGRWGLCLSAALCLQAALLVLTLVESRYPWCRDPRFAVGLFPAEGGDEVFPRQPRTGTSQWALPSSSGCGEACVVLCGRVTSQARGDFPGTREEMPGVARLVPAGRRPCSRARVPLAVTPLPKHLLWKWAVPPVT